MKGLLIDITRCTGCGKCAEACAEYYNLGKEIPGRLSSPDGLSSRRYASIIDGPKGSHIKKQCLHCLEPACVSACLVGALQKTELGPVIYDASKCIGCRYCMLSCPFKIPRYEWEKTLPFVQKCHFCYPRQKEGMAPLCSTVCPYDVMLFDDRDKCIAEAERRLKAEPKKYIQKIWGKDDAGGTCYMYISHVDPSDVLGFPKNLKDKSIPEVTWPVVKKTPWLAGGVLTFLVGTFWVIERRIKLAEENQPQATTSEESSEEEGNKNE